MNVANKTALADKWKEANLNELASVIDCKHQTTNYVDVGIPIVSPGNIQYSGIKFENCKRVSEIDFERLMNHCVVQTGDIVMGRNQSVGVAAIIKGSTKFALGQDTVLIRAEITRIESKYLHQFFQSQVFSALLETLNSGSTFKRINLQQLRTLPILLPPLPEQRRIAAILSQWDDSLSILAQLIQAKRRQKRGLAEQLLTGKRRLKGFTGEWKELDFQDLALIDARSLGSSTDPDYEFWYLSLADISNGQILFPSKKEVFSKAPSRARRIVKKDDVLLATVRPNLQSFAYVAVDQPDLIASTGFAVITARQHAEAKFLYYYLYSEHLTSQIEKITTGSNYPAISSGEVKKLRIKAPPLVEQRAIAAILSTLDEEINTLNALKAKVQEQKRGLMDLLLTGQVRVKVEEA